ncbi:uncharacterized protein LOC130808359 [Amaranthus tricolor]|uniref:uncharacterized protein LOC130808359 n=1 Tax=Amaranthus tricolor TaxID=29722 RepID=UPI002588B718|nr:uncharacterized protein LOC130808359 [Amaranthus tricolor]
MTDCEGSEKALARDAKVSTYEIYDMLNWMDDKELHPVTERGHKYSWTNKEKGEKRTLTKIDHAIGNLHWMDKYSQASGGLEDQNYRTWLGMLWYKLNNVKIGLKRLHRKEFTGIKEKIKNWEDKLDSIQTTMQTNPMTKDINQREREGERSYSNQLLSKWLYTVGEIHNEITQFYQKLQGTVPTNLVMIDRNIMREGRQIDASSIQILIQEVSEGEIKEALFGMNDNKAPRVDGFNSSFFKKAWDIIKQDLISAIKEFFNSNILFPPYNYTSVTLIPKSNNTSKVGEFRSISCCTVIYKIISRVLVRRLQKMPKMYDLDGSVKSLRFDQLGISVLNYERDGVSSEVR